MPSPSSANTQSPATSTTRPLTNRGVGSGTEKMTSIPMVESVAYFECGEVRRQICRVVTYLARRYCYAVGLAGLQRCTHYPDSLAADTFTVAIPQSGTDRPEDESDSFVHSTQV